MKDLFKILSILSFIIIIKKIKKSLFKNDNNVKNHYIFTFWEPNNSLPGYIKLCIKTWKKYLPNYYKIVILDYHSLHNYLDFKLIEKITCKRMTLPIQADAIRIAILRKFGGIWMDPDTIITKYNCFNMLNGSDLIMFGSSKNKTQYIGFIYASKNSTILKVWLEEIIVRIKIFKKKIFLKTIFPIKHFIQSFNNLLTWNYLGNGILDEIVKNKTKKDFKRIERDDAYVMPELSLIKGNPYKSYHYFYFIERDPTPLLKKCKGVLMLHNSWTPKIYKDMTEEEFLQQKIMLASLLSRLLTSNISIPKR